MLLALLLLATIGGFGSLFNLFVSPDIRACNRVVPFIAFLSLLAVLMGVERLFRTRRGRLVASVVLLVVGVSDQGQATWNLNDQHSAIAAEMVSLESLVQRIERALPMGAMVYQLPFRTYMSESEFGRVPMMILDQIGAHRAPFDHTGVRFPRRGEFKVSGWAVDHPHRAAATGVDNAIDRTIFPALYGAARRDVADYFQRPEFQSTGFSASIPADALAAGDHGLSVRVVSADASCYSQSANLLLTIQP